MIELSDSNVEPRQDVYAGFWIRTAAYAIDYLIVLFFLILVLGPLLSAAIDLFGISFHGDDEVLQGIGFGLGAVLWWYYTTGMESSKLQATGGKLLLKLRVSDLERQRIAFSKANVRFFSKLLSAAIFLFGFIMVAITKQKQGLHDKIAGTIVVRNP